MRFLAIIPVILCVASLVLSFLALFAGYSKGFMEDYALLNLNTSRYGQNYFNNSKSYPNNPFANFIANVTHTIENQIEDGVTSTAHKLGLHDFYSWHVLNFCEGFYTPTALPNSSFPLSAIHKNITGCAHRSALYNLRPGALLQAELTQAGHGNINVSQLGLPSNLDDGLAPVRLASEAMYVLYIISIVLLFVSLGLGLVSIFVEKRILTFVNFGTEWLALLALSTASTVATTVAVEGAHQMNEKMNRIGVAAQRGTKFLVLTWVATACLFVAKTIWCVDGIAKVRRARREKKRAQSLETVETVEIEHVPKA